MARGATNGSNSGVSGLGGDDEQAVETVASPRRQGRKRRAFTRVLLVVCGIVLLLAGLLWTQRKPIADNLVRRELEKRGVAARYRVAQIGLGRQRLVDVVLGDPKAPDLIADWVEIDTDVSLNGARVTGARVGQARLRATLRPDGTVSFGQIDKLLPPPSGKPFALPDFDVAVDDGRIRLATPYGVVGAKLAGKGNLANGFTGTLAAVAERLALNGCGIDRLAANLSLRTATTGPSLTGPIRARTAACGDVRLVAPVVRADATLSPVSTGGAGGPRSPPNVLPPPDAGGGVVGHHRLRRRCARHYRHARPAFGRFRPAAGRGAGAVDRRTLRFRRSAGVRRTDRRARGKAFSRDGRPDRGHGGCRRRHPGRAAGFGRGARGGAGGAALRPFGGSRRAPTRRADRPVGVRRRQRRAGDPAQRAGALGVGQGHDAERYAGDGRRRPAGGEHPAVPCRPRIAGYRHRDRRSLCGWRCAAGACSGPFPYRRQWRDPH
ncbi:intermembrane phospholipid transport protein YdbH family protein [Sphingomonas panni]